MRVVQAPDIACKAGHLCLSLIDTDAIGETGVHSATLVFAIAQPVVVGMNERLKTYWNPEVRNRDKGADEIARHNPDYGEWCAVETNSLTHNGGVVRETLLPEIFADKNGRICCQIDSSHGFECAAAQWRNTQNREVIFGNYQTTGELDVG